MLCPADSFMTWQRDKAVKLQMSSEGPLSIEPESIMTVFRRVVQRFPDNLALGERSCIRFDGDSIEIYI